MALEAVVFPHELFIKEWYLSMWGGGGGGGGDGMGACSHDLGDGSRMAEESEKRIMMECDHHCGGGGDAQMGNWDMSYSSMMNNLDQEWDANNHSSPENRTKEGLVLVPEQEPAIVADGRRKRRKTKMLKNKEEVENQRMTHIAVERNRRKQMNEYLAVLRSLMPPSYVQRGDQASIIGGAINFVKELEQLLQFLEAEKRIKQRSTAVTVTNPFTNFFTFPQYSMCSSSYTAEVVAENRSAIADIEVTMVESHANLKALTRRRPRQLLRMVVGLENIRLTTLHLNVTTVDHMVLYSFSAKVEDDCQLNSADEIATAAYRMLEKIQEESESFT